MSLPIEDVGSWVTNPDVHWFGRCDGCGKRRIRILLYDCWPIVPDGHFRWQCDSCMIDSLTEKLEALAEALA